MRERAGFLVLKGNLFDSAIMKTSVITDEFRQRYLENPKDPMAFEGKAIVFDFGGKVVGANKGHGGKSAQGYTLDPAKASPDRKLPHVIVAAANLDAYVYPTASRRPAFRS